MAFNQLLRISGISLLMVIYSACAHSQQFSQQFQLSDNAGFISEKSLLLSNAACENDNHPGSLTRLPQQTQSNLLPGLNAIPKGTAVLFEAVIAIDIDNEFLWKKFSNNESNAPDWLQYFSFICSGRCWS